jgi:multiple sugar transport system ATP-binding protein
MGDRIAVMRVGILQQVGTPPQLYTSPVNVFVAAFIGSPAMNFATVRAEDGKLKLGSASLELSGRAARAAEERKGKDLLIGFRPEDLEIANGSALDGAVRMPAKIEVVEYLGNQELLHADAEGNEVIALVPSERDVKVGQRVEFTIPSAKLHLFDPQTEETIV